MMIIIRRLFLLLFLFLDPSQSASIHRGPLDKSEHRFDRLIHSVVRKSGQADVIRPTVCPPSCEHLHQAIDHQPNITLMSRLKDECSCTCPPQRPVYLSSAGSCVDKLQECENTIQWKAITPTEVYVPVVHLFPHSVILPHTQLDWEGAKIQLTSDGQANCTISRVFYENIHHRWKAPPRKTVLFELTDLVGVPIIYFRGTEFDASFLSGAVVQIKLQCRTLAAVEEPFCISIRVSGTSGSANFADHEAPHMEEGWRIEIILLLAFVTFIVITLIITLIIWNICWKIKKRKLISDFQLQFIQQFRHHSPGKNAATIEDVEIDEANISANTASPNRRRLYFSSEYFDRDLLENPPPMAEQFLFDLRRMVDMAKDRIRQRRFCPTLHGIEEDDEDPPPPLPTESIEVVEADNEDQIDDVMTSSQESSPRSEPKSIDSGRESKEDSEEEIDNSADKKVADLVKNFEKGMSRPSQLPVLLTSSMRRKSTGDRPSRLALPKTSPTSLIEERKNEIESRIRPPAATGITPSFGGRSLKERKGYAVFPSDGTFNKSLPRRPKRLTPPTSTSNIPITTG